MSHVVEVKKNPITLAKFLESQVNTISIQTIPCICHIHVLHGC